MYGLLTRKRKGTAEKPKSVWTFPMTLCHFQLKDLSLRDGGMICRHWTNIAIIVLYFLPLLYYWLSTAITPTHSTRALCLLQLGLFDAIASLLIPASLPRRVSEVYAYYKLCSLALPTSAHVMICYYVAAMYMYRLNSAQSWNTAK